MIEDIIKERIKKRDTLIKAGVLTYPSQVKRTHYIGDVLNRFFFFSLFRKKVSVTGRVMGMRAQGGVMFLDFMDESGRIQAVLNKKTSGNFALWKDNTDIGDFISVTGTLFKTKKGQRSVKVLEMQMITKSLRPLPSSWHGFKDVEERYRKRYLDFILNKEVKDTIEARLLITKTLRNILEEDGFVEVETPMLQPLPGGATAKPFKTHHNALDTDFYLRIAPELYLKRLLVGGFEKIFEVGKDFRNEGMDRDHNPEFTMLELYWAYQDYEGLMAALRRWFNSLLKELSIDKLSHDGKEVDFNKRWEVISYEEAIRKYSNKELRDLNIEEIDEVFKKDVRPKLIQPTLVIRYPKAISPLAKSCVDDPEFTERFQLVVAGTELVNGFSELNDPADQRERMEKQEEMFRAGDEEA
ncbi:lysine--tRNA ligase, partial [Candidatus Wolfebacteria bacterium]|nr:lysine--tRNA ligase [Candidatus Wolfebacteria bacterium]